MGAPGGVLVGLGALLEGPWSRLGGVLGALGGVLVGLGMVLVAKVEFSNINGKQKEKQWFLQILGGQDRSWELLSRSWVLLGWS